MDNDNLLEEYYTQNARKLRRMVDGIYAGSAVYRKRIMMILSWPRSVAVALRRFDSSTEL
ncbi:MAG: hypothetical protein ACLUOI_20280 [Eisenbergiella sp.]